MRIFGILKVGGIVKVMGVVIKVRGCWERWFFIFVEFWVFDNEIRIKVFGIIVFEVNMVVVLLVVECLKFYNFDFKVIFL